MSDLESVGVCELVAEMLRVSTELTKRDVSCFDKLDVYRLLQTAENILKVLSRLSFHNLASEEKRVAHQT